MNNNWDEAHMQVQQPVDDYFIEKLVPPGRCNNENDASAISKYPNYSVIKNQSTQPAIYWNPNAAPRQVQNDRPCFIRDAFVLHCTGIESKLPWERKAGVQLRPKARAYLQQLHLDKPWDVQDSCWSFRQRPEPQGLLRAWACLHQWQSHKSCNLHKCIGNVCEG